MFNVNSKKAIRRLSVKSFRSNKARNIIAALAIALTAILFTVLFTVGSGMIENIQRQTMRMAGGDGMAVLKYITDEQYEKVKGHELIKEISYNRLLAEEVNNEELLKRHGELYYMDDTAMKLGFCEPEEGHRPQAENEIIMDTRAIKMLGLKQEVGVPVTLNLTIHGKAVERDFVLAGWWEADPAFNVSIMVASRAYVDAHIDELYHSYNENSELTGAINSYIMFDNSFGLEGKLSRVITESGYSNDENSPNYIPSNVNWSYMSTGFDLDIPTVAGVSAALLLIILAGYLIIYNIFQISVIRDIRFYGLLKTIGTTGKQIKRIIRHQAFLLSCIGIPVGLFTGYLIGVRLVPVIMAGSYYATDHYQVSANPLIFVGSTVFVLITVAISTAKPGRIAAKVSPIEAVRYTDSNPVKKKSRKSRYGTKVAGMAVANLGRNKKRTVLVVLSMSLSIVLFNTVYTLSIGFDMDKYLSKFVDTDFLIAHADYFNYDFTGPDNSVSERMIEAVQKQPGFEEGGRLFANIRDAEYFRVEASDADNDLDNLGNVFGTVYGLEDLPLKRLDVLEGEIDIEKLKTGKYILEGIQCDDHGAPYWETSHYEIGDKIVLHNYKGKGETAEENEYQTYEFELMAKVGIDYYTNSCGVSYDYSYYLPAEIYKKMVDVPGVMSYVYNVNDGSESAMDRFLEDYTENVEPTMNYSSKITRAAEFEDTRNMVLVVGGVLSFIVGMIGALNFANSMLTSILTRRREFAMLQSVGMTTGQLRKMLIMEGLYYTAASGVVSLILGIFVSLSVVSVLAGNMWFFSYQFTMLPLLVTIPVLLVLGCILPLPVLAMVEKQSIVDRLREVEG